MSFILVGYVCGVLALVLDLYERNELSLVNVMDDVLWPVRAGKVAYNIVAPAISAVIGYIVDIVNTARGK